MKKLKSIFSTLFLISILGGALFFVINSEELQDLRVHISEKTRATAFKNAQIRRDAFKIGILRLVEEITQEEFREFFYHRVLPNKRFIQCLKRSREMGITVFAGHSTRIVFMWPLVEVIDINAPDKDLSCLGIQKNVTISDVFY